MSTGKDFYIQGKQIRSLSKFAKKLSVEILVFVQIPSHFRLRNMFLLLHRDKSAYTETPIENRVKGGIVWKYDQF